MKIGVAAWIVNFSVIAVGAKVAVGGTAVGVNVAVGGINVGVGGTTV